MKQKVLASDIFTNARIFVTTNIYTDANAL